MAGRFLVRANTLEMEPHEGPEPPRALADLRDSVIDDFGLPACD